MLPTMPQSIPQSLSLYTIAYIPKTRQTLAVLLIPYSPLISIMITNLLIQYIYLRIASEGLYATNSGVIHKLLTAC